MGVFRGRIRGHTTGFDFSSLAVKKCLEDSFGSLRPTGQDRRTHQGRRRRVDEVDDTFAIYREVHTTCFIRICIYIYAHMYEYNAYVYINNRHLGLMI